MKIYSSKGYPVEVSASKLEQELRQVFRDDVCCEGIDTEEDYLFNFNISESDGGVLVEVAAEVEFDYRGMDYSDYKFLVEEFAPFEQIQSPQEYYNKQNTRKTLEEKMTEVLQSYNSDWYFELYDPYHIQAYLDNCILKP